MILETSGLSKVYPSGVGCRDISVRVKQGTAFGLLGPNGAGKSTFVKMIVGLLKPTSGSGAVMGNPIGRTEARRHIGYLPELFRFQDWLTAREVLAFHGRLAGLSAAANRSPGQQRRIREVLSLVGLDGRGDDRVRHFSKGMQQRLGIACALLTDPELIILDEPASALDPIGRFEVRSLLQELRRQGKTIFLNTHLLEDVEALCDEVAFVYHGKLKAVGPLRDIIGSTGRWEISVGGWLPGLLEEIRGALIPGTELHVREERPDGSAVLTAVVREREQVGWINRLLSELELTLYEVRPVTENLEQWFLSLADGKEDTPC
ncbi:ATP-binding cassette domain-containing protein [Cohnella sp. CFH 77786]|uniref:ABC transporter ATP-binding protein n=1 Tax=Cohnella sp. CFH 77786 TaxID=2662265 RepID=UPI001C60C21D|nr:ABC transporter ATP-binding protein [Cohnella sp. CFH 77786]MBW5446446.1 ATP-binding cassette domain-containing protein [Cohnella sp. CFH 77786]